MPRVRRVPRAEEQSRDTAAEASGYPLYIAKYEYQPRTKSDLGFGKKDLLYIINTGDEDCMVVSKG